MTDSVELRACVPDITAVLRQLLYHAIFVPPGEPAPNPEIMDQPELAAYTVGWGRPGDQAVFALKNGQVVGGCWTRLFPPEAPGYGTLDPGTPELSIAVLPGHRGQGLGNRMLTALLEAIQPDYDAVTLSVSKNNPALRLYRRYGFQMVEDHGNSLVMRKFL